ncbi:MAG: phage BR0599 family protein [Methyloceanibacter sp.]|nr:phage BR0599 family protein [Methyloceanibacter sp.]
MAYANNWFTRGLLTWLTGANTGRAAEVKLHSKDGSAARIELWQRMSGIR